MKKTFLKSVFTASIFCFSSANSATLYVEKWGNPSGVCSAKDPCDQITTALNIASPNSRVLVGPGRYDGGLSIQQRGIKLESTGGPQVTIIDATNDDSGIIGIDIQADRVSVGKAGGKGFTILSKNAEIIRIGELGNLIACEIDTLFIGNEKFFYGRETRSPSTHISGTRIQGNILLQRADVKPASIDSICWLDDYDSPNSVEVVERPSLNAISVVGDGVILTQNNIVGSGTNVVQLSNTIKKSTIIGNNIKHDFSDFMGIDGFPFRDSLGFVSQYDALRADGKGLQISNNLIEKIGSSESVFTVGLVTSILSEKIRVVSNVVKNFDINMSIAGSLTVSKNIVLGSSLYGIADLASFSSPIITDNIVHSSTLGTGMFISNARFVRGNNISGFSSPALIIDQRSSPSSPSKVRQTLIANNNFYDVNDFRSYVGSLALDETSTIIIPIVPVNRKCAVFIRKVETPTRMSKNFYGSTVEVPQIKESSGSLVHSVPGSVGSSWHICAANGLVSNVTGRLEITNVTSRPSLRPNRIRAVFKSNPL